MNQRIPVSKSKVKSLLNVTFPNYRGRKISVEFTERVTFMNFNWGGGTKCDYRFVRADDQTRALPTLPPWRDPFEGRTVELPQDVLVVMHEIFCGNDVGITIYAHPANAPRWLTAGGAR